MTIWIPERIYRLTPLVCVLTGLCLILPATNWVSLAPGLLITVYGVIITTIRRINHHRRKEQIARRIAKITAKI